MQFPAGGLVPLLIVAAVLGPVEAGRAEEDHAELLQMLRGLDEVYNRGLTIEGSQTQHPRPGDHVRPEIKFHLRFTWQAPHNVVWLETEQVPRPAPGIIDLSTNKPHAPLQRGFPIHGIFKGDDGKIRVNLPRKTIVYFDEELSGKSGTVAAYEIAQDGTYRHAGDVKAINLDPADVPNWTLPYKRVLWSSGRGFAAYLQQIETVETAEDGTLQVYADGFESPGMRGQWELRVDPQLGYLVREAVFRSHGEPIYTLSNEGVRESEGTIFPQSAEFHTHAVPQLDTLSFDTVRLEVDSELLKAARAALDDRAAPGTFVYDGRTKSPIVTQVDSRGKVWRESDRPAPAAPPQTVRPVGWRLGLLVLNVVLASLFVILLVVRRIAMRNQP